MEHRGRLAIPFGLGWLGIFVLTLTSCSNAGRQSDGSDLYRNMNIGVYNIIAATTSENDATFLVLRGSIDKQPIEELSVPVNRQVIDAQLGDVNADGIPEVYCLTAFRPDLGCRIYAYTLDGQRFQPIEVETADMAKYRGHSGDDAIEVQDADLMHQFAVRDSTGSSLHHVRYALQRKNGGYRLLPKPELSELPAMIENAGLAQFHIGDRIDDLAIPSNMKMQRADRLVEGEEGPYRELVYSLLANSLVLMEFFSYEDQIIDEILLHDTHFKTREGIGVQSRLLDFIKAYPDYKLWYTYVSDRFIAETPNLPRVQFLVERDAYAGPVSKLTESRSEQSTLSIEDFTSEARIERVRIF